eukprot:1522737-Karenia_brevis.AAC.1
MITPRVGVRRSGGERSLRSPPKPADRDASTIIRWSDIDDEDDDEQLEVVLRNRKGDRGEVHGNVNGTSSSSSGSGTHGNVSAAG